MPTRRKSHEPGLGQESLYEVDSEGQLFIPSQPNDFLSNPGIYVDLRERNTLLIRTLSSLALASRRAGFQEAASSDNYRPVFIKQYGKNLPRVVEGAANNEMADIIHAKMLFKDLFKMDELSAVIGEEEAKAMTRESYEQFERRYGWSNNRVERDKYRKRLKRNTNLYNK